MNASDPANRILVLNPNSSASVTRLLDESVAPLRRAGDIRIECVTLDQGPRAIESDDDVSDVAPKVRDFVAGQDAGAFVIACFSDPGLEMARRATRRPVYGMAECGYAGAMARGGRFGVISILAESLPRHRRHIRALGIESRLAADLPLGLGVLELSQSESVTPRLREIGHALISNHGADVLVLGCAGLAAYRTSLENDLGVPVIEPVQAAVSFALGALMTSAGAVTPGRAESPTGSAPAS